MQYIYEFFKKNTTIIISIFIIIMIVIAREYYNGMSLLGSDGSFGRWDGDIWSSHNSQRVADIYSLSHIIHGILLYGILSFLLPKIPIKYRLIISIFLESMRELLENSPIIINRYREATIAQGYIGDSILNSVSDIFMMMLGFGIAYISRVWQSVIIIIAFEIIALYVSRDNLTLNIWMLIRPTESIKQRQYEGKQS